MGFLQSSFQESMRHNLNISKLFLLLLLLLVLSHSSAVAKAVDMVKVGVILDLDSRLGDQMRMAIEIACQDVNNNSSSGSHYIKPYYLNSHAKPLQAISAADKLIKRQNVKVIIGLETWEEATLVAEIANQSQVPVISFAKDHRTPPLMVETLWPSLFRMSTDESDQIKCIADIVSSYNRQRVSIIYEAEAYDTTYSKMLNSLSEELGRIGSTIEEQLILETLSSPAGAEASLEKKLTKLKGKASPIFIVLGLSSLGSAHFLKEAKKMGLFYGDSTWIFAEKPFANLLTSVEHSGISSAVGGTIGIITYRPQNEAYTEFRSIFLNIFHHKYGEDFSFEPGIDVVRAYDCIKTIKNAIDAVPTHDIMPEFLQDRISRTRLEGLSGAVRFKKGQLVHRPKFQLVSVNGNEHRDLKIWSPNFGFSTSFVAKHSSRRKPHAILDIMKAQEKQTSSENKPWLIGVPVKTPFDKFVTVERDKLTRKVKHIGFCIDVFEKVILSLFPDGLKYEFKNYSGTYDDLVGKVRDKVYDAAVGDITILSSRLEKVEFTLPFMASDLSVIVQAKQDSDQALIFMKPFTPTMWLVSGGVLLYTMLVVWFFEHTDNAEFGGRRTDQLSAALWFIFSSLFFAHKEKVHRNFARIVVVIWFFVVLILTQSYTASLTSMLTVQELKPTVTTIEQLRISKANVGCNPDTFICNYLINTLHFSEEHIVHINSTSDSEYGKKFRSGNISALFLELPYARAFYTRYRSGYMTIGDSHRFGGFGFVFPKGSPLAANFSRAILKLSQSGEMKKLEDHWFPPMDTMRNITSEKPRLGLRSFWALYAFTIATSTGCLLLACLYMKWNGKDPKIGSNRDHVRLTETEMTTQ